jgi:exoenzyme U
VSETLSKQQWVERVLGCTFAPTPEPKTSNGGKKVKFSAVVYDIPPPQNGGSQLGVGRKRSGKPIEPVGKGGPPTVVNGEGGRKLEIAQTKSGTFTFKAPPPPLREITFSGGGGKGSALPGAIYALEQSGMLKDAKVITGASVGSMTAALVAAGVTAEDFDLIANAVETTATIKEGKTVSGGKVALQGLKNFSSDKAKKLMQTLTRQEVTGNDGTQGLLTGDGLQAVVGDAMVQSVQKAYAKHAGELPKGQEPDEAIQKILDRLLNAPDGPTFMELRTLSQAMPDIKEVVISGTYKGAVDQRTNKVKEGERPQLAIFSADTEPNLPVSVAVHASASFPIAFKPVDIFLEQTGEIDRFQDGGILNNAPTLDSIGTERNVDPMPTKSGMTFVFEGDGSEALTKGEVSAKSPTEGKIIDKVVGAKNTAGEFAQNRGLADKPEDIVIVPLKYPLPPAELKKLRNKALRLLHLGGKEKDFTGLGSGTLNFDMTDEEKTMLSTMTEQATNAHIEKRREPKTTEFKTADQMLMCVSRADLASMAQTGFDGAKDALDFRDLVVDTIGDIIGRVKQLRGQDVPAAQIADDDTVKNGLALLETQAGNGVDRQGFVGRELNRTDDLEGILGAIPQNRRGTNTLKASQAVSDKLRAQTVAKNILQNVVYPKLVRQDRKGAGAEILMQMDAILRAALSPDDVNDALDIGIQHFKTKSDKRGVHGHAEFAQELADLKMKPV